MSMPYIPVLFLAGVAQALLTSLGSASYIVKERMNSPSRWHNVGLPSPNHQLNLRIALPQANYAVLEERLYQISSPQSAQYGHHLTKAQVEDLVQPRPESVNAVEDWLAGHGIDVDSMLQRSPAGDWIYVQVPVALAERMLSTKYYVWKHADGTRAIRTIQYSLPANIHQHIEFIQPTTSFLHGRRSQMLAFDDNATRARLPMPRQHSVVISRDNSTAEPACKTKITLDCLKQNYNTDGYETNPHNGNKIGVTGFLDQYANKDDLQVFFGQQLPEALNSTFKEVFINGGMNSQNLSLASPEADLDIQYALGLTYPTPGVFYSTGGLAPSQPDQNDPGSSNEPYLEWVEYLLAHPSIPQTISTSYGDDEQSVPRSYAVRVCQSFAQLGARGVSLLFGSGDSGVAGSSPESHTCITNDGTNTSRFIPNFPAGCPFVTAVGATQGFDPEVATTRFASGGGFSDYFGRPAYAEAAISNFFDQFPSDNYEGLYNIHGAPIPDVSAQGDHYQIIWKGVQVGIGGASAATPTFASIVSMLNDARITAGKTPLGWLNPLLYTLAVHGLNDVVEGSNPGCGTPGFNATRGWDPVTGLGTPDFRKLQDIVLNLP